ncbi:MAG: 30S ribosomal protein S2, partial [Bacteroidetes bacterium]|nr:30S ribosomal protein S2 [Bacteroidota bacterium]
AAIFIVDILKEHISLAEAKKLNIPTFAIVDTNSDPRKVDFPIPANDDASKSISIIIETMVNAIEEGLVERKLDRDKKAADEDRGEQDEDFDDRMKEDEIEEEVAGIKLAIKEHPDAKLQKMKPGVAGESEEKKSQRKRISKPAGRPKK